MVLRYHPVPNSYIFLLYIALYYILICPCCIPLFDCLFASCYFVDPCIWEGIIACAWDRLGPIRM